MVGLRQFHDPVRHRFEPLEGQQFGIVQCPEDPARKAACAGACRCARTSWSSGGGALSAWRRTLRWSSFLPRRMSAAPIRCRSNWDEGDRVHGGGAALSWSSRRAWMRLATFNSTPMMREIGFPRCGRRRVRGAAARFSAAHGEGYVGRPGVATRNRPAVRAGANRSGSKFAFDLGAPNRALPPMDQPMARGDIWNDWPSRAGARRSRGRAAAILGGRACVPRPPSRRARGSTPHPSPCLAALPSP